MSTETGDKGGHCAETRGERADRVALSRRGFLELCGVGAAATMSAQVLVGCGSESEAAETVEPAEQRRRDARTVRTNAAQQAYDRGVAAHPNNGEEAAYPYYGNFSKGLPQNARGEVDPPAYRALLKAVGSGAAADFDAIPLGGVRKLVNPQAGLAFDLEGPDSHALAIPPGPRIDSALNSSEAGELYWMALTRDVPFDAYMDDDLIAAAAEDMSDFTDFRGPKVGGQVTPATIYRGTTPGDLAGPYISQFLYKDVPNGSLPYTQHQITVLPNVDYLTTFDAWLQNKRGARPASGDAFDPVRRYIRNGRDLGQYVHIDTIYQAYFNACLVLFALKAPLDPGNPYAASANQAPFVTLGDANLLSLLGEVANRALKAIWFQKWFVHRRARPEEFGGLVHNQMTGTATYPINPQILDSEALQQTYSRFGTYLLPQAFPEGSPLHPAYGAGHAAIGGACATILKAWFVETATIANPVVPNDDGTELVPYTGADAGALTIGGELDKLASNVAYGRNFGGIHWRTDGSEGIALGETVAIQLLQEQKATYAERHSFSLTKFDGTTITI